MLPGRAGPCPGLEGRVGLLDCCLDVLGAGGVGVGEDLACGWVFDWNAGRECQSEGSGTFVDVVRAQTNHGLHVSHTYSSPSPGWYLPPTHSWAAESVPPSAISFISAVACCLSLDVCLGSARLAFSLFWWLE